MNIKLPAALCALALAGSASATGAYDSYKIRITGFVPVICHATLDASMVPTEEGQVSLGALNEFCNSPNGYQVYVDSSPELADASLIVDGEAFDLSENGSTLVSTSSHANIASRDVALDLPEGVEGGSLSVRIVAL